MAKAKTGHTARRAVDSNAIVFDRESVRREDENGFLHVATSHISKAAVNPYYGREIPGWKELGLDPDTIYQVLRPADELEKAAASFNNLPVLLRHEPISADDIQDSKDLIIGSTGTDAEFDGTYLNNSLAFYDAEFISRIESGEQRELSSAYRYVPVLESGTFDGKAYTIKMTEIVGNHVALVEEGRAGADVLVGDSNTINKNKNTMKKLREVRLRALAIAQDAKSVDVRKEALKIAQDADVDMEHEKEEDSVLSQLKGEIDQLEQIHASEEGKSEESEQIGGDSDNGEIIAALEAILSKLKGGDAPAEDEDPDKKDDKEKKDKPFGAQDAAVMVDTAVKAAEKKMADKVRAAAEVAPITGRLDALAFDSAADVYKHALDVKGIDTAGIDASAFAGMARVALKHSEPAAIVIGDSATHKKLSEQFPGMARIEQR